MVTWIPAVSKLCHAECPACSVFAVGVPGACEVSAARKLSCRLGWGWGELWSARLRALCEVGWDHSTSLAEGFLWDRQVSQVAARSTLLQEQPPSLVPRAVCGPGSRGRPAQGGQGVAAADGHSCAAGHRKAAGAAEGITAVRSPLQTLPRDQQVSSLLLLSQ